jgi:hypothetical protein
MGGIGIYGGLSRFSFSSRLFLSWELARKGCGVSHTSAQEQTPLTF